MSTGAGVLVTLPPLPHPRATALDGLDVMQVEVPDAAEGMAASIRAGVAALPQGTSAVMILPSDMPELDANDMATLLRAHAAAPRAILRGASEDGTPGHPVMFPADLFPALLELSGDQGARPVLRTHSGRIDLVTLPLRHALTDLDTPEAWAEWRAETGHRSG